MRIDILCKPENGHRCELVLNNVRQALKDAGVEAEVHLYKDRRKMIDARVYVSPAMLVDDILRVAGRVPEVQEIIGILAERPRYHKRMQQVA
ncbi:MAG: thioredoxin family protein [Trichloromonadaceae bacterium]